MRGLNQYPRGLTGVGLLLLRVTVGVLLLLNAQDRVLCVEPVFFILLVSIISFGFAIGIITPIAGVAGALSRAALFTFFPAERTGFCATTLILCVVVSILGAGAYSFDGILFGPRRIIV